MHERLKGGGRWVFAALAVVFALSFVLFGVGNAGGLSLLDYLQGRSSSSSASTTTTTGPSVSALNALAAKTKAAPSDSAAWIALGDAQTTRAASAVDTNAKSAVASYIAAVASYQKASDLKPSDVGIQTKLAQAYASEASAYEQQQQQLLADAQKLTDQKSNANLFVPGGTATNVDPLSKASDGLVDAATTKLYDQTTPLQTQATAASTKALAVYEKITALTPNDAVSWFNMAVAAQGANDKVSAIKGFREFLRILPNDPLAPQVKSALDQLDPPKKAATKTGTSTAPTATAPGTASGTTTG